MPTSHSSMRVLHFEYCKYFSTASIICSFIVMSSSILLNFRRLWSSGGITTVTLFNRPQEWLRLSYLGTCNGLKSAQFRHRSWFGNGNMYQLNNSSTVLQFYFSKIFNSIIVRIPINMLNGVVDRVFSVVQEPADALNSCCFTTTSDFARTTASVPVIP